MWIWSRHLISAVHLISNVALHRQQGCAYCTMGTLLSFLIPEFITMGVPFSPATLYFLEWGLHNDCKAGIRSQRTVYWNPVWDWQCCQGMKGFYERERERVQQKCGVLDPVALVSVCREQWEERPEKQRTATSVRTLTFDLGKTTSVECVKGNGTCTPLAGGDAVDVVCCVSWDWSESVGTCTEADELRTWVGLCGALWREQEAEFTSVLRCLKDGRCLTCVSYTQECCLLWLWLPVLGCFVSVVTVGNT